MDELANNLLLPGWSEELSRRSPLRNVTAVDPGPSHPDVIAKYAERPLPDTPQKLFASELDSSQKKPNLSSQAKTPRVIRKSERQTGRPKISKPVPLVVQNLAEIGLLTDTRNNHQRSPSTLKRSMTEVGNLSTNKINNLINLTTVPEGDQLAKGKGIEGIEKAPRMSPLRRGRQALAKASRALAGQLSRSSSTCTSQTSDRNIVLGARGDSLPSSSHGSVLSLRPNTDDDASWARHNRRIAEGENLGRPKIKAMTSDGRIRRKPLPLQESTNLESSSSFHHTRDTASLVSGNKENSGFQPKSNNLDFQISRGEPGNSSDVETSSQFDHLRIKPQRRSTTLPPATRESLNYLVINGLAQHPNTLAFASPPRKISMPKTRGASQANMDSQKRVSSSIKSVIGFEDRREDDGLGQAGQNGRPRVVSNGSVSVKRKSASRDLRSQLSIAMKRTRRGSIDSNDSKEDLISGAGTEQRDGADRPNFITRERNRLSVLFNHKAGIETVEAERQGFIIFDSGRDDGLIPAAEDKTWVPRGRGSGGKKSSSHRRSSLFSRGSRTQSQLMDTNEGYDMAIDELQMENPAYQVGGTRT